jgi:capsular polysaccharide biosynthesis protein
MAENKTLQKKKIDYGKIYSDLLKYKKLYYIVLPVAFVVATCFMLSIPNYYTCTVKLSPELSGRSVSTSSLASLASSFGVKLGSGMGNSSEALFPTLYPDLIESVDFKASLFNVKVRPEDSEQEYSYYDYKRDIELKPWWKTAIKSIIKSFKKDDAKDDVFNPRKLTKKQSSMAKEIEKDIVCKVDKKTMVISISAKDTDPLVCTTMADSAMALLQKYITNYRTSKARVDLEYNKKILSEAKANYEKASRAYASFSDANLHSFQERILQRKAEMETEMMLQRTVYQQVVAQYQQAEMKLQEETPAFAVIQASTIPAKKTGPNRFTGCVAFVFFAFLFTTVYILYKEKDLKMLFGM